MDRHQRQCRGGRSATHRCRTSCDDLGPADSGGNLSLPMFSPDGRSVSAPFRESRDHDVVRIFETATGRSRVAIRLPFHVTFRAGWADSGGAVVVNRNDQVTHIVLFENFWPRGPQYSSSPSYQRTLPPPAGEMGERLRWFGSIPEVERKLRDLTVARSHSVPTR